MAEQYYCVGDVYYGGPNGTKLYKNGEVFPMEDALPEHVADLRANGALKTGEELAPTNETAKLIAAKEAEISRLQALLDEANSPPPNAKKAKTPTEVASEVL